MAGRNQGAIAKFKILYWKTEASRVRKQYIC